MDEYSIYRFSLSYRNDLFISQFRAEHLNGTDSSRTFLQGDVFRKLDSRYSLAAGFSTDRSHQGATASGNNTFKLTASYRDAHNPYSGLASLRYNELVQSGARASGLVFNAMQNYKLSNEWEAYAHQGIKRSGATFDGEGYLGWSYLLNAGMTYRIDRRWDLSASVLSARALSAGAGSRGASVSVGHVLAANSRLEVGYQFLDRYDRNFSFSEAYVDGFFLRVAFKFDESTFGLDRGRSAAFAR